MIASIDLTNLHRRKFTLEEIRGQYHAMFMSPPHGLWVKLGRGAHDINQCKRIGKGGKQIWIQAVA
jgi:hypothetical protein